MNCYVNEPLQITLADAVEFLNHHGISYALVGGLAASLRGQTRVTADVDMVLAIDLESALRLIDELSHSKFSLLFDGVAEVVQKSLILPVRHRETGVKVDLAIGLSGFEQQADPARGNDSGGRMPNLSHLGRGLGSDEDPGRPSPKTNRTCWVSLPRNRTRSTGNIALTCPDNLVKRPVKIWCDK